MNKMEWIANELTKEDLEQLRGKLFFFWDGREFFRMNEDLYELLEGSIHNVIKAKSGRFIVPDNQLKINFMPNETPEQKAKMIERCDTMNILIYLKHGSPACVSGIKHISRAVKYNFLEQASGFLILPNILSPAETELENLGFLKVAGLDGRIEYVHRSKIDGSTDTIFFQRNFEDGYHDVVYNDDYCVDSRVIKIEGLDKEALFKAVCDRDLELCAEREDADKILSAKVFQDGFEAEYQDAIEAFPIH